jgi:4-hydroxybenzoyl-CoA thioesterase
VSLSRERIAAFLNPDERTMLLDFLRRLEQGAREVVGDLAGVLKDGELAVEGRERRVWAGRHPDDPARMKAAPIPEELVRRFRGE